MKLICRLRPQPNNTSQSTINSRKEVRTNIFSATLSNESPTTLIVSSKTAVSQKIISEYLRTDADIMKQRSSIIENADLFQFDQVFGEKAPLQLIYDQLCSPKVNAILQGNSATFIIIGGPNSGKRYTIKGERTEKGLSIIAVENLHRLMESSKVLKGKGKLVASFSCVNDTEVIDLIGASRSTTIKTTAIKAVSDYPKLLNSALQQYDSYIKEHPQIKNNHIFIKIILYQDKQEIAQLHFLLLNEFKRANQEFQVKLKSFLIQQQEFPERDLDTKTLQALNYSLRETKFNSISTLFCVSQIQQDHFSAYLTLQFSDELRQQIKPQTQTQRITLSQPDNQSQKSRVSFGKENLNQQLGSKTSLDSKNVQMSQLNPTQVNQSNLSQIKDTLHQSKVYQSDGLPSRQEPSRQEIAFSRQFQELKDLLKDKETLDDYKISKFEKEMRNLYEENGRLQSRVYQQEDSIKQRDLLIAQMENHMEDNKRQMDVEHHLFKEAKQKEGFYEQTQDELREVVSQLNQQLRVYNEEGQVQKQRIKMLESDIEMLKDQEMMNVRHYEKREDEFMQLIQQEQERNKQLYSELDYFSNELKNSNQETLLVEEKNKTLNKVIEDQCKRIEEEKNKNKELTEQLTVSKQKNDEMLRDLQTIESKFTRARAKLETENQQMKVEKEKYSSKYKDKLKKYKSALKTAESENATMKLQQLKLQTENDQLHGMSRQLENQIYRNTEVSEKDKQYNQGYELDKIRQQNLQLNAQLRQADYEIKSISQELNNAIHHLEKTSQEYERIIQENEKLKQELSIRQNETKQNEFMIEKMVELGDKQLDDIEGKFNKVTAQVNALQHEKKSLISENITLKQQLEQNDGNELILEKRIVKLRKENKDLNRQLKDLNQNMKEMILEKNTQFKNTSIRNSNVKLLNQSYRSFTNQRVNDYQDEDDENYNLSVSK